MVTSGLSATSIDRDAFSCRTQIPEIMDLSSTVKKIFPVVAFPQASAIVIDAIYSPSGKAPNCSWQVSDLKYPGKVLNSFTMDPVSFFLI